MSPYLREKKTNPNFYSLVEPLAGALTCYSAIDLSGDKLTLDKAAAIAGGIYLLIEGFQIQQAS